MNEDKGKQGADDAVSRISNIFLTIPGDALYGEVLRIILEVTESRYGIFGYINEKGDLMVPSMTKDIWEKCQIPDKSAVFRREWWGESIWARALKQKETLFSNEISHRTPKGHIQMTRSVAAPIVLQGKVIGLLQVANKETDYGDKDVGMLNSIAATLAPLLNVRLEKHEGESTS
jgi:GAF domain-containing protein